MTDIFKKEYIDLNPVQKELVLKIKTKAEELHSLFSSVDEFDGMIARDKRCTDLAEQKLEESIMWIVKSISY